MSRRKCIIEHTIDSLREVFEKHGSEAMLQTDGTPGFGNVWCDAHLEIVPVSSRQKTPLIRQMSFSSKSQNVF